MAHRVFRTSFGWAGVAVTDEGVCTVVLPMRERNDVERELTKATGRRGSAKKVSASACLTLKEAVTQIRNYFSGKRVVSFDLPLDLRYYTPFQRAVWTAVEEIPCGRTRSYAWIARRINRPRSARAVGQAMGANPIPIIIP
jgi:O6-methylguanine-DNA--protein-cysteine methyltransferase